MKDVLELALFLAESAEPEIMSRFRVCAVEKKADGTEVTEADRRAEALIREIIGARLPGHVVLGEEYGGPVERSDSPMWVIDPIDGTASFALGLPMFGTLIGYLENGEPQVGVMHFPALGETIYAARGMGCWARIRGNEAKQVRVSGTTALKSAYVSIVGGATGFNAVISRARRSRPITDCVQHALVAEGRIDAAFDPHMKPWDIAAIVPCIEEAGGAVSDLEGNRDRIVWRKSLLSSSSRSLHEEILRMIV